MLSVARSPYEQFFALNGEPLEAGYLYYGQPNQDPEQYPIQIYWDEDGLIPATLPIRTVSGYPSRNGSPAQLYVNGAYSLRVKQKNNITVFYVPECFAGSVGSADANQITYQVPGGISQTVQNRLLDYISVADYGATGNGVTDDSAAIQSAITAAKAANRSVRFPTGTYVISTLAPQNGRIEMIGDNDVTIKGTFTYNQPLFPASADTLTPLTPTSPYLYVQGINFQSTTSDFALILITTEQGYFYNSFTLENCNFFGAKGLLAQQMIGFSMVNCTFNNLTAGARFETCTNGLLVDCRFQNQAESGVWITRAASQSFRLPGGENIKFVGCEWAVCTYGLYVDQAAYMTMESCLIDFCANPIVLMGAQFTKLSKTYVGAADTAVAKLSGVTGYLPPITSGIALYGKPGGTGSVPYGTYTVNVVAESCEFVNYTSASTQPVVLIDGYASVTFQNSAERISFNNCLFLQTQNHTAPMMLEITHAKGVRVYANRFFSFNKSNSMTEAYRMNQCENFLGFGNDFLFCQQMSVVVESSYESFNYSNDGYVSIRTGMSSGFDLRDQSNTPRLRVFPSPGAGPTLGFLNANVATSASAGGATALPATPAGYMLTNVNGTSVKIPYYA